MMKQFRENPPNVIDGSKVVLFKDYRAGVIQNLLNGQVKPTGLPTSNVIQFLTEDNSLITVRPSGTEPKIKFYFSVHSELKSIDKYEETQKALKEKITRLERILTS